VASRAFILIETQVGSVKNVVGELRALEGVVSCDIITGPFDVITLIAADDMGAVADLVTGMVQRIHGVVRTITCVSAG
jgi:DNA-binding Lrp family transcriptional regulator